MCVAFGNLRLELRSFIAKLGSFLHVGGLNFSSFRRIFSFLLDLSCQLSNFCRSCGYSTYARFDAYLLLTVIRLVVAMFS